MMIYDVKEDPILQDSSQEPSMSSMCDFCHLHVVDGGHYHFMVVAKSRVQNIIDIVSTVL